MTPADLESVVARTGHERFRWLTSDGNPDAAQREGYRGLVTRMAAGFASPSPESDASPPATVDPDPDRARLPLAVSLRALKVGHRKCFYATPCGCAGGGARCHHLGRVVALHDCVACLESIGTLKLG
jgi:hypothetical protein